MQDYDEYDEYEEDEGQYYAVRPNKTRIKKEYAKLFALGDEMSQLSAQHLHTLELPESIHNAVTQASTMRHDGARKRLLKFIAGKLYETDIDPILEKLNRIKSQSVHAVREHHIAERWRDRLLNEGNDALTELLFDYPHADAQHLRQLLRNAHKESTAGQPPKSARLIYRYIKELQQQTYDDDVEFDDEEHEDSEEEV